MKYFTTIDAIEEFESAEPMDGVMLTGDDCLMRTETQRLVVQSLLLDPPKDEQDERLARMLRGQTILWLEKIEECAHLQICIRLPDRPVDAFLPRTEKEFARLGAFIATDPKSLQEKAFALRTFNPELSCRGCRMMIANDLLFRTLLCAIFDAAAQQGVRSMSLLLPFVSESREVSYIKDIIAACAAKHGVSCTTGIEIATPRAACIAGTLAAAADAIVFNVEELVQLMYGMSRLDSRKVISHYMHEQVFLHNPFREFDTIGIGTLLTMAVGQIQQAHPGLRLSATGHPVLSENGRKFCSDLGIDILIGQQHLFRTEKVFGPGMSEDPQTAAPAQPD